MLNLNPTLSRRTPCPLCLKDCFLCAADLYFHLVTMEMVKPEDAKLIAIEYFGPKVVA